jgi:putative Mg2+ transporter-C (MgtC) family protein
MMLPFTDELLRLLVATALGAIIGWERERHEHNAGLRTNALVALGTALFTIISAYGFIELTKYQHISLDPTRVASYIVAGIGFLGAGTIFLQRDTNKVKGLTSAATIWVVAAIGMASGAGLLIEAASITVLTLLVLIGLRFLEVLISPAQNKHLHRISLRTPARTGSESLGRFYEILSRTNQTGKPTVTIEKVEIHPASSEDEQGQKMDLIELFCFGNEQDLLAAIADIQKLPGVQSIAIKLRNGVPEEIENTESNI